MTDASRGTDQPPIGDYGIIGDCRTAALVSRSGSIDWLCLPRFDSPSVFGAILDTRRGGRFSLAPTAKYSCERRYLPGTNVLETTFRAEDGVARLTDAMMITTRRDRLFPEHEILRRVECLEGSVEVEGVCDPRFDYGRRRDPGRDRGRLGVHFDGGATGLVLRSDLPLRPRPAGGWSATGRLSEGERRYVSLASETAAPVALPPLGEQADARIDATAGWWRAWLQSSSYEGEYDGLVTRSMLTLKLLAYPPSGAIVAAPTAALPEVPGGERNWDYRYCWLRDASMTLEVFLHLGFAAEGESFLGWLLHATRLSRPRLQVLYDVHGRTDHPAGTLDHFAGYRGARPVRVGNAAASQHQLDLYGEVLRAAWTFTEQGGRVDNAESRFLRDLGRAIRGGWSSPGNGMWEVRGGHRHYTHSKAMCWVGLRCLLDLADGGHVDLAGDRPAVEATLREIRERTDREGWNESLGSYVAWYGGDEPDAALLLLGTTGYLEPDSERMESTRQAIRDRLDDHGLLRRYRYDDRLPGEEGAFGICGFWEAELLARQGRVQEARRRFEYAASFANDLGLLSEQMDARTGELWGNFPQAFTHIGLVSAANAIARSRGAPPETTAPRPGTTEPEPE